MSIENTLLTTSALDIFQSTTETAVTAVFITNYSTSANASLNVWLVKSGDTASSTNKIYSNVTVTAGNTFTITGSRIILDNGDAIQANANTNNLLTASVSYTQI